jgi:hypothetical protein
MRGITRQGVALLCAGLMVGLPVSAAGTNQLVGVAVAAGPATINGQRIYGQTSVYSGDRLQTSQDAPVTVVATPQEKIRLAPASSARLLKNEKTTLVTLEQGSLDLDSAGSTHAVLGPTGIEVRPAGRAPAVAEVSALPKGIYQVSVAEGTVEVVDGDTATTVDSGHIAVVGMKNSNDAPTADKTSKKKKVLIVVLLAGANIGAVAGVLANEGTKGVRSAPVSPDSPQ